MTFPCLLEEDALEGHQRIFYLFFLAVLAKQVRRTVLYATLFWYFDHVMRLINNLHLKRKPAFQPKSFLNPTNLRYPMETMFITLFWTDPGVIPLGQWFLQPLFRPLALCWNKGTSGPHWSQILAFSLLQWTLLYFWQSTLPSHATATDALSTRSSISEIPLKGFLQLGCNKSLWIHKIGDGRWR